MKDHSIDLKEFSRDIMLKFSTLPAREKYKSLSHNVKQVLRNTAAAVATKTGSHRENIEDNMEQIVEGNMVSHHQDDATEMMMGDVSYTNDNIEHGLDANTGDIPYIYVTNEDGLTNNGNNAKTTDARVKFATSFDDIPWPYQTRRPRSKIPRYKIKNLREHSSREKSKSSKAGGQSAQNDFRNATEMTQHFDKSYATYQRTTSSNRAKRLTEETACMTSVHTQVFMHPQSNNFQPIYQKHSLPSKPSRVQAFQNAYNTPANSFEMYNQLLDNFYKFCDVLITKNGFVNTKTFEERRAAYNEIVIRNATISHSKQQEDPSPASTFNKEFDECHKRFDKCLREMKDREFNVNNFTENKKMKHKRTHQKCPELSKQLPNQDKNMGHINSSIIVKVQCQDGVMKLKKLKPRIKKNFQTRFHSVPTQTVHSALTKRHSRHRSGKRVSFSSGDEREKQFKHLAKTCFSSCRRVDKVPKLNSEDVFKIILPDDCDFDQLKHTILNRGDPVIGILKTGKKNNCCFKKAGNNYYEIQLKAKEDPVESGRNESERRKVKKY